MARVEDLHRAFIDDHFAAHGPSGGYLGGPELSPYSPRRAIVDGILDSFSDNILATRQLETWQAVSTVPSDATGAVNLHDFIVKMPVARKDRLSMNDSVFQLRKLARLGMVAELPLEEAALGANRKFYRTASPGWELVSQIVNFAGLTYSLGS